MTSRILCNKSLHEARQTVSPTCTAVGWPTKKNKGGRPTKTESDERKQEAKPHIFRYAGRGWGSKKMRAGLKRHGIPLSRMTINQWRKDWGLIPGV
jgi:hypothetical protein